MLREFSRAAFARNFLHGQGLKELGDLLGVAAEAGPWALELVADRNVVDRFGSCGPAQAK